MSGSTVKDVMSQWVSWVSPDMLLDDAITLMRTSRVSHLFVGTPENLLGVLSEREVQAAVGPALAEDDQQQYDQIVNGFTVEEIMAREGVCVEVDASVNEAAELLAEQNRYAVPVLEGCKVVGLITRGDVVPVFAFRQKVVRLPYEPAAHAA
jgi:CBS domain-containing protein